MSLYNYFSKFGAISYNDALVSNIITSVRIKDIVLNNDTAFYPYVIKEGDRPDTIANDYYEDSRYAWVVLLSNKIIDPYYEWPLTTNNFQRFIIKKYGSITNAQSKIAFYRNNWYTDDSVITVSAYNALPVSLKKYWSAISNFNGTTVNYERKKDDSVVETNQIVSVNMSSTTGFLLEENVTQRTSGTLTGQGTIKAITSTSLVLQHIVGSFSTTAGAVGSVVGSSSATTKAVTSSTVIKQSIPLVEVPYYNAIDFYSYENEINESKKHIQLIDRQLLSSIEDQMIELLR